MKALAIVMMLAATAHAESIVSPAGWHADADKAADQAARLRKLPHFGGGPTEYGVSVYAPAAPGIVLYVTRLSTTANSPVAVRAALDDFELATHESGVQVGDTSKRVDDAKKQIEATIGLRDRGAQLMTLSVFVAAADAKHLVVVTGDCIARDDIDPKLLDACKLSLATVDPDVAPAERVAIALPTADTPAPPTADPIQTPKPSNGSHMDDGSHLVLPPIVVPQEAQSDRRPIYIGAGLIVLAAAFWWNRKRRERFERVDRGEPPAANPKRTDDDSDDLHAAAAGDDKDKADD